MYDHAFQRLPIVLVPAPARDAVRLMPSDGVARQLLTLKPVVGCVPVDEDLGDVDHDERSPRRPGLPNNETELQRCLPRPEPERMYLAPAEASGITPGGPPMTEADWGKLIKEWFPGLADRRLRQVT
ncbi:hypothetical protein [Streptomyces sp. NPDC056690]|uniref:hypothetical protein n=1 Tax=unclassified Streptomyces TaxID=2593676 RepID=UPI00362AAE94